MEKITILDIIIEAAKGTNTARKIERLLTTPTMTELCKTHSEKVLYLVKKQDFEGLKRLGKETLHLEDLTVRQLRALARDKFAGWYRMDKYLLIEALTHYESGILDRTIE